MAAIRFRFVIRDEEAVLALIEARQDVKQLREDHPWMAETFDELEEHLDTVARAVSIEEDGD